VDLFEYQARDLFESHQIPVLAGAVATTADQAYSAAEKIGGKVVVKAQVKVGGRGKAGGVKLAENAADAKEKAGVILGMDIKGHIVKKVMIAQAAPIESEYYLAILLDRANRNFLVMASVAGGMEIEEVAHKTPEKLARVGIDPNKGIDKAQALEIAKSGQFPADVLDQVGNGAGLVMSTLDVVAYAGEKYGVKPANFLDIGGGASAEVMANGLSIILGDSDVKSVFVNVFGGITACDAVANGIVQALEILGSKATKPIVVRLDGNNVELGRKILSEANHPLIQQIETMDGAAAKAAELAASK